MATNSGTIFKWATILIIFIGVLWLLRQVGCYGSGSKNEDPVIKRDTTYIRTTDTIRQTVETLVPYRVEYVKSIIKHDTLTNIEFITGQVDSAQILEQYFATRFYSVTSPVQYGEATINDTVTQNRITGRSIILRQDIPVVKETTEKKRVVLYFGIAAIGNKEQLPFATGATLDLKFKNDFMIGGGAYLTGEKPMFGMSLKFPVRLRKR